MPQLGPRIMHDQGGVRQLKTACAVPHAMLPRIGFQAHALALGSWDTHDWLGPLGYWPHFFEVPN